MCYGENCTNKIISGPNSGECRTGGHNCPEAYRDCLFEIETEVTVKVKFTYGHKQYNDFQLEAIPFENQPKEYQDMIRSLAESHIQVGWMTEVGQS